MGILCVFCVYDTIGNRCFEKTSFPKMYAIRCHDIDNLEVTIGSLALEHTLANRIIDQIFYFTVRLKINLSNTIQL